MWKRERERERESSDALVRLVLKAGQVAEDNVLFAHAWVLLSSQKGSESTSVGFGNEKFSEPRERARTVERSNTPLCLKVNMKSDFEPCSLFETCPYRRKKPTLKIMFFVVFH